MIDTHELAWAAGFFDGEGCTLTTHSGLSKRLVLHVSITQIDRQVLDRFHAAVLGVGKIQGPYTKRPVNRKPIWRWRACSFADCQATIALLWRFLSPIKRQQALAAVQRYAARPPARPGGRKRKVA